MGVTEKERDRELGLGCKMSKDCLKYKKKHNKGKEGSEILLGLNIESLLAVLGSPEGLKSDCVG